MAGLNADLTPEGLIRVEGDTAAALPESGLLYGRKAENGKLLPGGAAVLEV